MGTALICFYILTNQDSNIFGCIWSWFQNAKRHGGSGSTDQFSDKWSLKYFLKKVTSVTAVCMHVTFLGKVKIVEEKRFWEGDVTQLRNGQTLV